MQRALIVDDSRFLRLHLRQLVERMGFACDEAADAGEALVRLHQPTASYDFMLLDVNMPGMSGLECVRELRSQNLQPPMKVMMVTTETDHTFIAQALDFGADEFLMKPFTPASLKEKLTLLGLVQ
jgi:two-component system chemotaxis response regulator CheY